MRGLVLVLLILAIAPAGAQDLQKSAADRHDYRGFGLGPLENLVQERSVARRARFVRHSATTRAAHTAGRRGGSVSADGMELIRRQAADLESLRAELASIRRELRPDSRLATVVDLSRIHETAARLSAPVEIPDVGAATATHVFPATGTQRGQHGDRRRTHRHAGIDIGGAHGSPIVAAMSGQVLPSPGRDRGYGPRVVVVRGSDGIVYRYAHLSHVNVSVGSQVSAGEVIGAMGKVGRRGWPHLHFEMIPVADYKRRPYGLHRLDPNDHLGGGRGKSMVAGVAMVGEAARRYASVR